MLPTDMSFVGVDPGINGAAFVTNCKGTIYEFHPVLFSCYKKDFGGFVNSNDMDIKAVIEAITEVLDVDNCIFAAIEKVHAITGQGISSTFRFGYYYGLITAGLRVVGLNTMAIHPKTWKSTLDRLTTTKSEERDIVRCADMYDSMIRAIDYWVETGMRCNGRKIRNKRDIQGMKDAAGISVAALLHISGLHKRL